jgi:hypothetical protein
MRLGSLTRLAGRRRVDGFGLGVDSARSLGGVRLGLDGRVVIGLLSGFAALLFILRLSRKAAPGTEESVHPLSR